MTTARVKGSLLHWPETILKVSATSIGRELFDFGASRENVLDCCLSFWGWWNKQEGPPFPQFQHLRGSVGQEVAFQINQKVTQMYTLVGSLLAQQGKCHRLTSRSCASSHSDSQLWTCLSAQPMLECQVPRPQDCRDFKTEWSLQEGSAVKSEARGEAERGTQWLWGWSFQGRQKLLCPGENGTKEEQASLYSKK